MVLKYEEGGSQKKTYKRLSDDIDLDALATAATIELRTLLPLLNPGEQRLVQKEFNTILQGMYDGTFTYRPGGGWTNTVGITNDPKPEGFDALGIAAGIIGDALRSLPVYQLLRLSSKFNGFEDIGTRIWKSILGPSANAQYFINLDKLVDNKRGHHERLALLKKELDKYLNDDSWKDTGASPELIKEWRDLYLANQGIWDNDFLDEHEYLALSKLLGGIGELEKLFYTGNQYALQDSSDTKITPDSEDYVEKADWYKQNHPRLNNTKLFSRTLSDTKKYSAKAQLDLYSVLNGRDDDYLLKLVKIGMRYLSDGTELNNIQEIKSQIKVPLGKVLNFSNNYIISLAVEILRSRRVLKLNGENSNDYYIPIESDTFDTRGTGLMYRISTDNDPQILEMDRNDILHFTSQWDKDYFAVYKPSNRNGGILKFDGGGKYLTYDTPYIDDDDLYSISLLNKDLSFKDWKGKRNDSGAAVNLNVGDKYTQNVATGTETTADAIAALNAYINKGKIISDAIDALNELRGDNTDLLTILNIYNDKVKSIREWQQNKLHGTYNDRGHSNLNAIFNLIYRNYSDYNKDLSDILGSLTFERLALAFENLNSNSNQRSFEYDGKKIFIDNAGYLHIGDYPTLENTKGNNEENGDKESDSSPFNPGADIVNEEYISDNYNTEAPKPKWENLLPDLISNNRLLASLYANNKVYNTILPSLKPVIKNTYELYSPVTGAFGFMLLKNRLAADVMSKSYKPFTSDASLAAARMLEGLRQANQLQTEGFLADDLEIKRTEAESLKRQEDNIARRSDTANFNRQSINQTNREKALLKATRINRDWQSFDNYLQGMELRLRDRIKMDTTRINEFYDKLEAELAEKWYNEVMTPAKNALNKWYEEHSTEDISKWPLYKEYIKFELRVRDMTNSKIRKGMSRRYNLGFNSRYKDEDYATIRW